MYIYIYIYMFHAFDFQELFMSHLSELLLLEQDQVIKTYICEDSLWLEIREDINRMVN